MNLRFEWDPDKAERNIAIHDVTFAEASTVFFDPLVAAMPDTLHSRGEERAILVGHSFLNRLLVVVHSEHRDTVRIISARLATRREQGFYEQSPS